MGYIFLKVKMPYPKLESLIGLLPINRWNVEVEFNALLWAHQLNELVQLLSLESPRVINEVMEKRLQIIHLSTDLGCKLGLLFQFWSTNEGHS